MKHKKLWISIGILAFFALLIHLFSSGSATVEQYYSTGAYPYISFFLRRTFGWLPFSFGDILYGLAGVWLLVWLVRVIKALFKRRLFSERFIPVVQRTVVLFLLIYIIFNVFWGINYNRKGIATQLGLSMQAYSLDELKNLNGVLLRKANESDSLILQHPATVMNSGEIFRLCGDAYAEANKQYSFLSYRTPSVKTSMWGWLGNYVGFMGYYNPFTGEGQVNTTIPTFLQPYTSCHEIAHQVGYAKENEANFVGYLAAAASKDASFHYSVYLELFLYANRNLFEIDSLAAKSFTRQLNPAVKKDLIEWRRFNLSHQNPVEPVIRWVYGKYLESNQQPSGVLSYDEVTGFLVAYYKKFGKL